MKSLIKSECKKYLKIIDFESFSELGVCYERGKITRIIHCDAKLRESSFSSSILKKIGQKCESEVKLENLLVPDAAGLSLFILLS